MALQLRPRGSWSFRPLDTTLSWRSIRPIGIVPYVTVQMAHENLGRRGIVQSISREFSVDRSTRPPRRTRTDYWLVFPGRDRKSSALRDDRHFAFASAVLLGGERTP